MSNIVESQLHMVKAAFQLHLAIENAKFETSDFVIMKEALESLKYYFDRHQSLEYNRMLEEHSQGCVKS